MTTENGRFKEALDHLSRLRSDFNGFLSDLEGLQSRYPDEYVAMKDGQVIVHNHRIEAVTDELEKQSLKRSDVVLQFVPDSETLLAF